MRYQCTHDSFPFINTVAYVNAQPLQAFRSESIQRTILSRRPATTPPAMSRGVPKRPVGVLASMHWPSTSALLPFQTCKLSHHPARALQRPTLRTMQYGKFRIVSHVRLNRNKRRPGSPIHRYRRPRQIPCPIARKKNHDVHNILRLRNLLDRSYPRRTVTLRGAGVRNRAHHRRVHRAGRERVDPHAGQRPLCRHLPGQLRDRRLGAAPPARKAGSPATGPSPTMTKSYDRYYDLRNPSSSSLTRSACSCCTQ
jgi:hypothetical protein